MLITKKPKRHIYPWLQVFFFFKCIDVFKVFIIIWKDQIDPDQPIKYNKKNTWK